MDSFVDNAEKRQMTLKYKYISRRELKGMEK